MNIPCVDSSAVDINPYNGKGEHGTCSIFTTNSEGDRRSPEELERIRPVAKLPSELVVKEAFGPPCRTVPKIYVCDLCEKKYRTHSGLKYHSRNCILRLNSTDDEVGKGANSSGDRRSPSELVVKRLSAPLPNFSVTTRRPSIKTSSFVLIGYTIMLVIIFYRISSIHIYH
jgi:hypothetical protein